MSMNDSVWVSREAASSHAKMRAFAWGGATAHTVTHGVPGGKGIRVRSMSGSESTLTSGSSAPSIPMSVRETSDGGTGGGGGGGGPLCRLGGLLRFPAIHDNKMG